MQEVNSIFAKFEICFVPDLELQLHFLGEERAANDTLYTNYYYYYYIYRFRFKLHSI